MQKHGPIDEQMTLKSCLFLANQKYVVQQDQCGPIH